MKLYEINNTKKYKFSCIYLWTNLINNKKYVGQTSCFASRMSQYRSGKFNDRMKKDIDLYGVDSFDIDILRTVPNLLYVHPIMGTFISDIGSRYRNYTSFYVSDSFIKGGKELFS